MSSVRIRLPLPGPLVKRLRHRPFTAVTWVRFPYGSPLKSPDAFASGLFVFLPRESKDRPQLCRGKKCPADIFSDYRKIVSLRASAHTGVAIRFLLYFRIHRKMKKLKPVMRAKAGQIICPTTASPSVPQSGRTAVPPGQPVPGTPLRNLLPGTVPCIPPDSSVSGGNSGAAGAW